MKKLIIILLPIWLLSGVFTYSACSARYIDKFENAQEFKSKIRRACMAQAVVPITGFPVLMLYDGWHGLGWL